MSTQQTHVSPKAAVALLTTTNGVLYMLLLLTHAANPETSAQASRELVLGLATRVDRQVRCWLSEQGIRSVHTMRVVDAVVTYVSARLIACTSRSPQDFATFVERLVLQCLEGDGTDAPAPRRIPQREEADFLKPAPKVERMAVLHAILVLLSSTDRRVMELRLRPQATWESVARAVGTSVPTAKRRHALATERAQRIALVVLSERLSELVANDAAAFAADAGTIAA